MLRSLVFLPAFTVWGLCAYCQISIVSTDLTSVGDQITRYADTVPSYGPGPSGGGVVWDFSAAVNDTVLITDVVATNTTPFASTFSGSDYAMTGNAASYLYFTHTATALATTGAAGDLLGTGEVIEAPFTDPLVLHQFPRTYTSAFEDTYAFQAEADGAAFGVHRIRLTHSGQVSDTTDGYGTLITPTGTYDVLRVRTTDHTQDVIEVQLSPLFPVWVNFTTVMDTTVAYSWHAKEEMLAIAEYSYDSIGNPKQFIYSSVPPVTTVGIGNVDGEFQFALYPQPASDQLFINGLDHTGTPEIRIFSLDGKMIRNERPVGNRVNISGLSAGMYVLRVQLDDGTLPAPMKFIIR